MPLFGKYLSYALLALALDLVWGYCGILSLGHGAFFALGGYAMGMYLMRQIGARGVYGNPILPDFMVFLNYKELPWFWYGFDHFWFAALMVVLVPGLLAFVFGWFAFRSRVTGVYLSIITQAMTYALLLAFFRNDMGFGGNNGLTDFKDILGFNVQADATRARRCSPPRAIALALAVLVCSAIVNSKLGKVHGRRPRRREPHALPRLPRRQREALRLRRLGGASPASPARSTCRRSASSIPANSRPANSIEVVIWTAVGGRGTHGRADHRRAARQRRQDPASPALCPNYWLFALGGLFVARHAVPAQGHRRHVRSLARQRQARAPRGRRSSRRRGRRRPKPARRRRRRCPVRHRAAAGGVSDHDASRTPCSTSTASRVSFDGFKALNNLSIIVHPRARCWRSSARTAPARRR